jgi:hypothetical protein
MTAQETAAKVAELLAELAGRVNDPETASLVQQTRTWYQLVLGDQKTAETKALAWQQEINHLTIQNLELQRRLRDLEKAVLAPGSIPAADIAAIQQRYNQQIARLISLHV